MSQGFAKITAGSPRDNLSFGFWRQGVKEGVCVVRLLAADTNRKYEKDDNTLRSHKLARSHTAHANAHAFIHALMAPSALSCSLSVSLEANCCLSYHTC